MAKNKLYTEPNYGLLEGVARELGIELTLDRSIRDAQKSFEQGIRPPGTESGHSPKEMAYITQVLAAVQEKRKLPLDLRVYMTDRGFANFEETFATTVRRERGIAFNNLLKGVEELHTRLRGEREG